jgi:hypothetical protein
MPLSSGDKLGPYEIVAPNGAGGTGEVYRGRDPRLARSVLAKIEQAVAVDQGTVTNGPSSQPGTALPPAPEPRLRGWLALAVAVGLGLGLATVSAIHFRERLPVAETIRFQAGRLPW